MPFFSVIVPVYNVEKYLIYCLESVLHQTFTDYEILLVDDGSQDNSGQICDNYAARYPNFIHVKHKTNQGQISARISGLQLAKGKYVCFLDSDDCLVDNALSSLHEIIETTHSDIVLFRWNRIDENGKELNITTPELFHQSGTIDKDKVFEKILSTSGLNSFCTKCCRYSLFDVKEDYSQYYQTRNGEDLIQSLPVLFRASTFYYLNEPLYQYRVNTTSISNVYRKGRYRTLNVVRPLLYRYIVKMGLDTAQNIITFFNTYLSYLWDELVAIYTFIPSFEERSAALDEVRSYEFVQKGRGYLDACNLSKQAHLGLSLFYKNNNKVMNTYMGLYLPAIKTLRGAKTAFHKHFR